MNSSMKTPNTSVLIIFYLIANSSQSEECNYLADFHLTGLLTNQSGHIKNLYVIGAVHV